VNPVRVQVTPLSSAAETVEQRLYHVSRDDKRSLLLHVLKDSAVSRALVFTRTKSGANRVARHLETAGIRVDAIHGNKSQGARERALGAFRDGQIRVLVATDIAARGIDVDGVSHVINFDIPNEPESYVHRIGRTGRAGALGMALSFCDAEERDFVRGIERTLRRSVPVHGDHPYTARAHTASAPESRGAPQGRNGARGRSRQRGGPPSGRSMPTLPSAGAVAPPARSRTFPKWG
jgi:ATP-dependent RNA helicase RhlE